MSVELSRLIIAFDVSHLISPFGPFMRLRPLSGASGSMTGVTERRRFRRVCGGSCADCGCLEAKGESGGVGALGLGGTTGALVEFVESDILDELTRRD